MRAIVVPAYGPASVLELRTLPDPTPGPGEVAIRMAGASLNPVDWKQRSGALRDWMPLQFPAVPGRDVSGTVVSVGPGVTGAHLAPGARVLAWIADGAYAEIVLAPAAACVPVPATLELADASALPLVLLTGVQLAEEAVDARAGDVVLVTGATGSVGRVAVFAAKARGAKVIAGVRGKHAAAAAKLGADSVVALDDDASLATLPTLDAIADTVGGETALKLLGKLKPGGKFGGAVGVPAGAADRGFVVRPMQTRNDAKRLGELAQAVADGKLVVPISRRFPLAEAAAAHALAEKGADGKVLLLG
jgi:NADPH:quinone reductase-like Zn-dependent oxidoreductase